MLQKLLFFIVVSSVISCGSSSTKKANKEVEVDNSEDHYSLVFIGTYTKKESFVDGKAAGVYVYAFDPGTGGLKYLATSDSTVNPSYIAIHPTGNYVFAVNETNSTQGQPYGAITSFRYDPVDHSLKIINQVSSGGDYPCNVNLDPTGRFLLDANYGSGTVSLIKINDEGKLSEPKSIVQHTGEGPTARQESPHAHMIRVSVRNGLVYSVDLGTDAINVYRLDTLNASLRDTGIEIKTSPGAGPRQLVFHQTHPWAYIVNELNGTIESFQVNNSTGMLTRFQKISTVEKGDPAQSACADIQIHPSGKFLYASNRGEVNSIAVFTINQETGRLSLTGSQSSKGRTPRSFVIDPSGRFLLVANQDTDNVVTFKIDPVTGMLTDPDIQTKVHTPVCLKFYPG